jgi:GLPGLI family protein
MKKIYFILLFALPVFSQNYRITYGKSNSSTQEDLDKIKDINVKNNIISINQSFDQLEYELLVNDKYAVFQYVKKLKLPNFNSRAIMAGGGDGIHYYDQEMKNEIFEVEMSGKKHYIKSSINKYKWEINPNDTKEISGFKCYKATAKTERKHNGITQEVFQSFAWFTYEIPSSFGPRGLDGLPGLVLEGSFDGKKVFFATSINKTSKNIEKPFSNKIISFEEYSNLKYDAVLEMKKELKENAAEIEKEKNKLKK